jgi:hypothetical protein
VLSSSISFCIAVCTSFSSLKAVNLVSSRAQDWWAIKARFAVALLAESEISGGQDAREGPELLG